MMKYIYVFFSNEYNFLLIGRAILLFTNTAKVTFFIDRHIVSHSEFSSHILKHVSCLMFNFIVIGFLNIP